MVAEMIKSLDTVKEVAISIIGGTANFDTVKIANATIDTLVNNVTETQKTMIRLAQIFIDNALKTYEADADQLAAVIQALKKVSASAEPGPVGGIMSGFADAFRNLMSNSTTRTAAEIATNALIAQNITNMTDSVLKLLLATSTNKDISTAIDKLAEYYKVLVNITAGAPPIKDYKVVRQIAGIQLAAIIDHVKGQLATSTPAPSGKSYMPNGKLFRKPLS